MSRTRVLLLSQGRATTGVALGHARVLDAVNAGLAGGAEHFDVLSADVPPFSLLERALLRRLPRVGDNDLWTLRWHLLRSLRARVLLERTVRRTRVDAALVTTDQVALMLGGLRRRLPCVPNLDITVVDWLRLLRRLPPGAPLQPDLRPVAALERRALARAPLTVAWTRTVERQVAALAPAAHVAVVHPGIDTAHFRPRTGPRKPGRVRVLFVGGRWVDKGGPELVDALAGRLGRDVELHAVTPSPPAATEGLHVHRLEPGSDAMAELFRSADVFCMPTHVDACPWAVVEALASGVPVVSTRVGSIPELVGAHAGRLVEPGDRAALSAALGELVESEELRASMGAAARERAETEYDARHNVPRLLSLLADAAAGKAR